MNRERTERIITQILRQPERFDMASYVTPAYLYEPDDDEDAEGPLHEEAVDVCGTSCCIAGWAVVNDQADTGADPIAAHYDAIVWAAEQAQAHGSMSWADTGARLLELPDTSFSPPLFFAPEWPYHYRDLYDSATEAVAAASLLRDMLDGNVHLTPDEWDRAEDAPDEDGFYDSYARQCAWWATFATNTTLEV